jgi:hypothetical protein
MTFPLEPMNQPRYVAGDHVWQPFLHFGQGKPLLDQKNFESAIETVEPRRKCSISHGIVRITGEKMLMR